MHENVFNYVILNLHTIVHNKKLTISIVYTVETSHSAYKSRQFQKCKQLIKFNSAYKISIEHCQSKIAIMHTKVVICNCCIQKMPFVFIAYHRQQKEYV